MIETLSYSGGIMTLFEREVIKIIARAMSVTEHNQVKAAKILGISRSTLRKYLKMGNYKFPKTNLSLGVPENEKV